jgi:hypothetical protein
MTVSGIGTRCNQGAPGRAIAIGYVPKRKKSIPVGRHLQKCSDIFPFRFMRLLVRSTFDREQLGQSWTH